jgi:hypothetical protein
MSRRPCLICWRRGRSDIWDIEGAPGSAVDVGSVAVAARFEGRTAAGAGVGVGVDVCLTAAEASVDVRGVVAVVVDVVVLGFTTGV